MIQTIANVLRRANVSEPDKLAGEVVGALSRAGWTFVTSDAYEAVCRAYWHWRSEAHRIGKAHGVTHDPVPLISPDGIKATQGNL